MKNLVDLHFFLPFWFLLFFLYFFFFFFFCRFSNNVNVTPVQKIIRNSRPESTEEEMESESSDPPPEDNRKVILNRIKVSLTGIVKY